MTTSDLTRKARICLAAVIIVSSACVAAEIPDIKAVDKLFKGSPFSSTTLEEFLADLLTSAI